MNSTSGGEAAFAHGPLQIGHHAALWIDAAVVNREAQQPHDEIGEASAVFGVEPLGAAERKNGRGVGDQRRAGVVESGRDLLAQIVLDRAVDGVGLALHGGATMLARTAAA